MKHVVLNCENDVIADLLNRGSAMNLEECRCQKGMPVEAVLSMQPRCLEHRQEGMGSDLVREAI